MREKYIKVRVSENELMMYKKFSQLVKMPVSRCVRIALSDYIRIWKRNNEELSFFITKKSI